MPRAIHTLAAEAQTTFGPVGAAEAAAAVRARVARMRAIRECPTPGLLAQRLLPGVVQTPMLDALDAAMVAADAGEQRRWVINTPPQEGKTDRICRDAALWLLLRNPDRRIIIASYQQNLAERSTLAVRRLVETYGTRPGDPDEDNRLGLAVDPNRAAAGNWRLADHDGGMVAVGIGSGTTGRPGDVIIVDDPVADPEAADSEVQRRKAVDWWTGVVQTRLVATSIVVVVQTRWNPEDLSGWVLANDTTEPHRYQVLAVPAQAEANDPLGRAPGEWLVSARGRTVEDWEDIRKEVTKGGARWWFALYQQRPAPPSGDTFRLEWFDRDRVWERPPGPAPVVVIDPADNTGSGDEAGIIVVSTDSQQRIYLGPDYSGHMTTARWVRVALLAVVRHEGGGLAYEQSLSGLDRSVRAGWHLVWKQARALHRHAGNGPVGWAGVPDLEVVDAVTTELCHRDDPDTTWRQVTSELVELWPLVEGVLMFPDTGPSIRRIIAKGTKQRRMQLAAPLWEQRRVSHIGALPELEEQLSQWQPGQDSPDRADCAIHGVMLASGATVAVLSTPSGQGPELPTRSTRSPRSRSTVIPRSTMVRR